MPDKTIARAITDEDAGRPWYTYIVRCQDGSLYTGVTTDLDRRINEHNGIGPRGARYTRSRRPVTLVYAESQEDRSAAGRREYAIKQLSSTEKSALIRDQTKQYAVQAGK